jgi:hypothetical protein
MQSTIIWRPAEIHHRERRNETRGKRARAKEGNPHENFFRNSWSFLSIAMQTSAGRDHTSASPTILDQAFAPDASATEGK